MVIDGNDQRGIDVGILSPFPIAAMRSHIDDRSGDVPTFSRDCPEYFVELPSGRELVILPNHFASKGSDVTGRRRKVQATAASQIYKSVRKRRAHVIVAGDLNDHTKGGSLSPLLGETDLVDAMALKQYGGAFPGTYGHATAQQKIDYLLLSPGLRSKVRHVDVFRKGFYAPRKWESFEHHEREQGPLPGVRPPLPAGRGRYLTSCQLPGMNTSGKAARAQLGVVSRVVKLASGQS